jgi:hypothetical protein
VNHKKIQLLWREEGPRVPQRRRRKRHSASTADVPTADAPNRVWAVDFQLPEPPLRPGLPTPAYYTATCTHRRTTLIRRGPVHGARSLMLSPSRIILRVSRFNGLGYHTQVWSVDDSLCEFTHRHASGGRKPLRDRPIGDFHL